MKLFLSILSLLLIQLVLSTNSTDSYNPKRLHSIKKSTFKWKAKANLRHTTHKDLDLTVVLPSRRIDDLVHFMDYMEEKHCVFKEGYLGYVSDITGHNLMLRPAYTLLTPERLSFYCKADADTLIQSIELDKIKSAFIPNEWHETPCFQLIGHQNEILASLCAESYGTAVGWYDRIVNYHLCRRYY